MKRLSLIVSLVWLLAGCSHSHEPEPRELPKLHGRSRTQVIAELGQPAQVEKFRMSQAGPGEFRIELQNTYRWSNPANANVEIEEMTWQDGNERITLWLHQVNGQWVVLDSHRWHKDDRF